MSEIASASSTERSAECAQDGSDVQRHEELWFEDGNIVLIAQSTAFKVHRSVLSRRSGVFQDLLTLPQPAVVDKIDGVPMVVLHDQAHELAALLDAIYYGTRLRKMGAKPKYSTLQALLRLGTKYEVQELLDEATGCLELMFPTFLNEWDAIEKDPPLSFDTAEIISMVNLAKELGYTQWFALALYRCCNLSGEQIANGMLSSCGTLERLASEDVARCIDLRTKLTKSKLSAFSLALHTIEACRGVDGADFCEIPVNWISYDSITNCCVLDSPDLIFETKKFICTQCRPVFDGSYSPYRRRWLYMLKHGLLDFGSW